MSQLMIDGAARVKRELADPLSGINIQANLVPAAIRRASNLAGMQAMTLLPDGAQVFIGYFTTRSEGGGLYYYDAASTETPRGYDVVAATGMGAGRFILASGGGAVSSKGTFLVPSIVTLRHAGRLMYSLDRGGHGRLLTDLTPLFPAGAFNPETNPTVKRYYVDSVAGVDSNDGLTWATAVKRVSVAVAKGDADVILLKGGQDYLIDGTSNQGLGVYTAARDVAVVAVGKRATMASARIVTWTAHPSLANVWESSSTGGTIVGVLDRRSVDAYGDYSSLTLAASVADVGTTPGSWYYASNKITVRLADNTQPNAQVLGLRSDVNGVEASGIKFYVENIHFIGGSAGAFRARNGNASTIVIGKDCIASHCWNGDGWQIKDIGLSIAIRVRASGNSNDGFNYHLNNGLDPHGIEIDCSGIHNLALNTGNGSSAHEDVRLFRINGDYPYNLGPGIADVNTAKTFNVNCSSSQNIAGGGHGIQVQNTAEIWMDGGTASNNGGADARALDTAKFHARDFLSVGGIGNVGGGATIDADFSQ